MENICKYTISIINCKSYTLVKKIRFPAKLWNKKLNTSYFLLRFKWDNGMIYDKVTKPG